MSNYFLPKQTNLWISILLFTIATSILFDLAANAEIDILSRFLLSAIILFIPLSRYLFLLSVTTWLSTSAGRYQVRDLYLTGLDFEEAIDMVARKAVPPWLYAQTILPLIAAVFLVLQLILESRLEAVFNFDAVLPYHVKTVLKWMIVCILSSAFLLFLSFGYMNTEHIRNLALRKFAGEHTFSVAHSLLRTPSGFIFAYLVPRTVVDVVGGGWMWPSSWVLLLTLFPVLLAYFAKPLSTTPENAEELEELYLNP